ncbi:MAG TPA: VOC family protein [Acidimicrobiales bacterium]|nr:VOC family protein [Acidimicrobiales bacterium]
MSDIIPVVPYEDITAAHDFLVTALQFSSAGLVEVDGTVVHGEVQLDGRRIWLHAAASGLSTPNQANAQTGGVVVLVPDVDAHFVHAKAAGATILREPTDQDYGQREYGVSDPEGHSWWIATPLTLDDSFRSE